jgi:hypothetical protein
MEPKTKRLNVSLSEDAEEEFRAAVFMKYGMKKGNIQIAAEEALHDWALKQEQEKKRKKE